MEPNLIYKFKRYLLNMRKGVIKKDPSKNDSGVDYEDLRSNDVFVLGFIILLTHNPDFAYCYKYRKKTSDGFLIEFDKNLFIKLFSKFTKTQRNDSNLVYVLRKLLGLRKYESRKSLIVR